MTEILRFEMNVPAEVALKYSGPGKPIEGRYGNRVMYTLADNRVMYVAPIVANRITDLGIEPGEIFQVCKQVERQGRGRVIEWQVQRLASGPDTQLERKLRESIEVAHAAKAAQPSAASEEPNPSTGFGDIEQTAPLSTTPPPTDIPAPNGSSNATSAPAITTKLESARKTPTSTGDDSGTDLGCIQERALPSVPTPSPAVVPTTNGSANGSPSSAPKNGSNSPPVTTKLEHALKTAISAAYNAEKYGAELGYVVRFDADAIKSMAITVLINMSEGNRR